LDVPSIRNMAKIYFICGFIGSGKTTYSSKLAEKMNAYRYTADEWMIPLFGEHMERDVFDSRLTSLKALFKTSSIRLLEMGVPVIFDFGFWKKSDRNEIVEWAEENSLEYELIYLDVSYEECCKRASQRNDIRGEKSYKMTPEMLEMFWSWFEVPTDAENVKRVSG